MDYEDSNNELFISLPFDVSFMRFIGNVLIPSTLHLHVSIERGHGASDSSLDLALTKWRYFIDNVVSKSIAFSYDNDHALDILLDKTGVNKTGNLFFLTPEEPSDEVIGAIMQAKFTALGSGNLYATTVEVTSDNVHNLTFTLLGDHSSSLPPRVEDYLGGPSFWDAAWWHRDDASSIDVLKPSEDAPTPAWAYSLDFLDRSTKAMREMLPPKTPFKPTIIDGGKPDDDGA